MSRTRVLVVDDEASLRTILRAILEREEYEVLEASCLAEARKELLAQEIPIVLSDLKLQHEDGIALLRWVKEQNLPCPVIILTAHGTVDSAVDAMKQGAFDYLTKPFERPELLRTVRKAALTHSYQANQRIRTLERSLDDFPSIGNNEKMRRIFQIVDKVAATDATVLITGESGTGKELIAQALVERGSRAQEPFIKINCAAIPPTLMESELFGYERGAFTGASATKPGRFELADRGTLFLDEIGEMPSEMQVKFLRVLQEKSFERVGGLRTIRADVRLIAATNQDLEVKVREGSFRADLFYRLNVVPIHLPPLRERRDDIPSLVSFFLQKFSEPLGKPVSRLDAETLELLCQFPWPGNIRQLENVIERMVVMGDKELITPEQLPPEVMDYEEELFARESNSSLKDLVKNATRKIEKKAIEEALGETSFNVTRAARKLNISRKGLQLKMKELGLR